MHIFPNKCSFSGLLSGANLYRDIHIMTGIRKTTQSRIIIFFLCFQGKGDSNKIYKITNEPHHEKTCLLHMCGNRGTDQ